MSRGMRRGVVAGAGLVLLATAWALGPDEGSELAELQIDAGTWSTVDIGSWQSPVAFVVEPADAQAPRGSMELRVTRAEDDVARFGFDLESAPVRAGRLWVASPGTYHVCVLRRGEQVHPLGHVTVVARARAWPVSPWLAVGGLALVVASIPAGWGRRA